jgi:Antibiotic biosynthesis monooxygenase
VVLMSTFLVPPDQVDNFLEGFKKQFAIMRKQPGLISAQLHRGILSSVQATQRRGERALRQSEDVDGRLGCGQFEA